GHRDRAGALGVGPGSREGHDTAPGEPDHGLDGVRVRTVGSGRRAALRGRSYVAIATIAAMVCAVQAALEAVQLSRRRSFDLKAIGFVFIAAAGAMAALFFARRAAALSRELRQSQVRAPDEQPDF